MAKNKHEGYVDISSNTQVVKLYKKKGRVRRILALILAIVLLIGGSGMLYYYNALNNLNFVELTEETTKSSKSATAETEEVGDFNTEVTDSPLLSNSKVLNVMLFGEDNHKKGTTGRSDSLILASIDNYSKSIKLTSFQRDTYVRIPGHGYNKITTAYSLGGAALAIKTVESNFGIKIDRYAVVDFNSFKKIIDVLGGVTMDLSKDEVEYINWQLYINHQVDTPHLLEEKDGKIKLTGQQALWYARDRGYDGVQAGDDWDRTVRQRKLLNTIFDSLRSASLPELIQVVSDVGPLVTTNLKKEEITGLVSHALTYMKYKVKQHNVPQDKPTRLWAYYDDPYAGSCIQITDMEASRKLLASFVYGKLISTT